MGQITLPSGGGSTTTQNVPKSGSQPFSGNTTSSLNATLTATTPTGYTYKGCTGMYMNAVKDGSGNGIWITSQSITPSSTSPSCSFIAGIRVDATRAHVAYGCTFVFEKKNSPVITIAGS